MKLDALERSVDELLEAGPPYDRESMETLLRVRTKVDAVCTIAMGEFDTWGEWAPDGARTAGSWVAKTGRLPRAEAGRLVKRARALARFP
ncbi:MAG TPA: hypothetical protein VGG43_06200, partial [Acidimicrobiales bacterium]